MQLLLKESSQKYLALTINNLLPWLQTRLIRWIDAIPRPSLIETLFLRTATALIYPTAGEHAAVAVGNGDEATVLEKPGIYF